jgi:hypothetical protein
MPTPVTAIICVRNEEAYLRTTLSHLVRNSVRLMIIDNGSTDGTRRILDEFGASIDQHERLEWLGALDLVAILEVKARLAQRLREGWIIHQDADEILGSNLPHETLRGAIERIGATGANAINFEEFVFLPLCGISIAGTDFSSSLRHYYFHEPRKLRLMRAWRAESNLSQARGGHVVTGPGRHLHPENLVLRHYPFLNAEHARRKYQTRKFAERGVARGWHRNRMRIEPSDMEFPSAARLKTWVPGQPLDTSDPWTCHYWVARRDVRLSGSGSSDSRALP